MIPNQLQNLKDKLAKKQQIDEDEFLIDVHHHFMVEYGWISIEEFKKIPIPTLWNLLNCIKKQREVEEKEYQRIKNKRK